MPKNKAWNVFLDGLNGFTEDFLESGREQLPDSERESI
ncbi:toxin-antitoxin system, antitoxin component, AbrB family [Leptospira weilii serovar Topaz str. LT2116]|uniref:Toxin-antitoxin system, antitoxin component, AbrB family n=1 Tax=Leptospira weilii serovar Topaz str. LT2116 TaxID=1088540 RepID=M3GWH7_9LEPT|nr:toxin-antitoxin system, antitoxin component, AbrB family [Leptospira weilii serovar Topaz str. LT2116]